jgi:hypothetical protein
MTFAGLMMLIVSLNLAYENKYNRLQTFAADRSVDSADV